MDKAWKIGIVKDTSQPMSGLHAAFRDLPDVEAAAVPEVFATVYLNL